MNHQQPQNELRAPTLLNDIMPKLAGADAVFARPLSKRPRSVADPKKMVIALVVVLPWPQRHRQDRSPHRYRCGRFQARAGFWAHVAREHLEIVSARVNRNAAATVVGIAFVLRVVAAATHLRPRQISGRLLSAAGMSMGGVPLSRPFSISTAAVLRVTAIEIRADRDCLVVAIARAEPTHLPMLAIFDSA
jgi:hypothetical protein